MGALPARRNRVISASYARIISASFRLVIGSTRIALLSISTITMMYLLPRCDLVGNCPVWSLNMVSLVLYTDMYTSRIFFPRNVVVLDISSGLVDLTFLRV